MAYSLQSQTAARIVVAPSVGPVFVSAQRTELAEWNTREGAPAALELIVVPELGNFGTMQWPTFSFAAWWKVEVEFAHAIGDGRTVRRGQVYRQTHERVAGHVCFSAALPAVGLRMRFNATWLKCWIRVIGAPSAWSGESVTIRGSIQQTMPGATEPSPIIERQTALVYDAAVNAGNSIQTDDLGTLLPVSPCATQWRIHCVNPNQLVTLYSGDDPGSLGSEIQTETAGDLADWSQLHPDGIAWSATTDPLAPGGAHVLFTATTVREMVTAEFR